MGKEKSIFKNTIYSILLRVFNLVIPIIVGAYPLNIFGSDLIGTINYSEGIYTMFLAFAGFGIYNYALREISKVRNDKQKVRQLFTSFFILGVITHLIVFIGFFTFITLEFKGQFIYGILLIYGFNMLQDVFYIEWVNEAMENYNFITKKAMLVRVVSIILLFTCVKTKEDFIIYALINTFGFVGNNLISYIYIRREYKFDFSNIQIKKHIKSLIYIMVIANALPWYVQIDKVLLGAYSHGTLGNVAFYNTPYLIISMINPMILAIVAVTVPRLSNIYYEQGNEAYERLLDKVTTINFMFVFPIGIGLSLFAKEAILLYARNNEYIGAIGVLKVFAIYLITLSIGSIFTNQIMYVKKQEKVLFKFLLLCGVVNGILKVGLISLDMFTPVMAATSTMIANIILIIIQYAFIRKKLKMNYNIFTWEKLKYLVYSLLFIPVTFAVRLLHLNVLLTALVGIPINAMIYIGILYLTKDQILLLIWGKIRHKK